MYSVVSADPGLKSLSLYGSPQDGEGRGEKGCCLHGISLVDDGPWWQGMRGQCVVDGDRDPAGGLGSSLDQLADVSFKGEVTTFMFHHVYPIHPLQTQGNMSREQLANGYHPFQKPDRRVLMEPTKQPFL